MATDGKSATVGSSGISEKWQWHNYAADSAYAADFDMADCAPDSGVAVALPAAESEGASRAGRAGNSSGASHSLGWLLEFNAADYRHSDDHRNIHRVSGQ